MTIIVKLMIIVLITVSIAVKYMQFHAIFQYASTKQLLSFTQLLGGYYAPRLLFLHTWLLWFSSTVELTF